MEDRTAQLLADCIDELEKGQLTLDQILDRYPEHRAEFETLLGLAAAFKQAPEVKPSLRYRLEGRRSLTNSLSEHNATERLPGFLARIMKLNEAKTYRFSPVFARAAVVVAILIFTSVISVNAAWHAMPGSNLYPVKIGLETLQLSLASDEKDLDLQMQFAEDRNDDILQLQQAGRYDDIQIAQADFDRYAGMVSTGFQQNGADPSLEQQWDETVKKNISVLEAVLEKAPEQAKPAIERAIENQQNSFVNHNNPNNEQNVATESPSVSETATVGGNDPIVTEAPQDTLEATPTVEPTTDDPKAKPTQKPTKEKNEPTKGSTSSGNSSGPEKTKTPPGNEQASESQNKDKPNKP
ncbi:MAG TPA: DUF5667 domain-containing protein [Anaerolineaceae bacterium]|nr:DUF5667 domain-containing protein [Anaerolineaceae bacterium]